MPFKGLKTSKPTGFIRANRKVLIYKRNSFYSGEYDYRLDRKYCSRCNGSHLYFTLMHSEPSDHCNGLIYYTPKNRQIIKFPQELVYSFSGAYHINISFKTIKLLMLQPLISLLTFILHCTLTRETFNCPSLLSKHSPVLF